MKFLIGLFSLLFFLFFPFIVFCQELEYPEIPGVLTPGPGVEIGQFLAYIYRLFLIVGALLAVISLIYGGILYLISIEIGNVSKTREAKDRIISAFFGLLILFGSVIILNSLDPQLTIFQIEEMPTQPPPFVEKAKVPKEMPKSYLPKVENLEENTLALIDKLEGFVFNMANVYIALEIAGLFSDLENLQKKHCSQTRTFCAPICLEPVVVKCIWQEDWEKRVRERIKTDKLVEIREIIENLINLKEVKDLAGSYRIINNCFSDFEKRLFINRQAENQGYLDFLNIGQKCRENQDYCLYFYCLDF